MNVKISLYNENKYGMNYKVFYPDNYKDLPLIIYLHGAGERGTNADHIDKWGVPKQIAEGREYPAVILTPQCPEEFVWDNVVERVKSLIDDVVAEFGIKKDRISITGSSMGGFGTFMMGKTYSSFFAGIAPVAGGGMSWRTPNLKTTPVFAMHGDVDEVVPILYSKLMVDGVNASGGNATLTVLEGHNHETGIDYAYKDDTLMNWLLKQRRTDFEPVAEYCSEWF